MAAISEEYRDDIAELSRAYCLRAVRESYYPESFGDGELELESAVIAVRFTRDRGQVRVDLRRPGHQWMDVGSVIARLGVDGPGIAAYSVSECTRLLCPEPLRVAAALPGAGWFERAIEYVRRAPSWARALIITTLVFPVQVWLHGGVAGYVDTPAAATLAFCVSFAKTWVFILLLRWGGARLRGSRAGEVAPGYWNGIKSPLDVRVGINAGYRPEATDAESLGHSEGRSKLH